MNSREEDSDYLLTVKALLATLEQHEVKPNNCTTVALITIAASFAASNNIGWWTFTKRCLLTYVAARREVNLARSDRKRSKFRTMVGTCSYMGGTKCLFTMKKREANQFPDPPLTVTLT